ncbi:hypothetical protein LSTR_LSTR001463 [Laodelphax striatellus]|uniref:SWIM-type domain-containing protein n=1 Tax=Laodelphax striatellus TaxID=195883 RepID=A0A482XB20_LAOST|nr:hypothetical protein LSTR_LSTR001463 [Laodelphax striatellus]
MDVMSEAILNKIEENYKATNTLSDDDYEMLYYTFGDMAGNALALLETSTIHKIETLPPSSYGLYKIESGSRKVYYVSRKCHICQCKFFKFKVKRDRAKQTCKHNVFCRMALILGEVGSPITIKLEDLAGYLNDIFSTTETLPVRRP